MRETPHNSLEAIGPGLPAHAREAERSFEVRAAQTAYHDFLGQAAQAVPEIQKQYIETLEHGDRLITVHEVMAQLFDDPTNALLFTAIAHRQSMAYESQDERVFLESAATLILQGYSWNLHETYSQTNQGRTEIAYSSAYKLQVYDRYTDHRLSAELQQAIDNGLLTDTQRRMQIDGGQEDPYEIRVLDIGDSHTIPSPSQTRPPSRHETEPLDRGALFTRKIGAKAVQSAWVARLEGKRLLCVPAPLVEMILHPEARGGPEIEDTHAAKRRLATVAHEYVHTQGTGFALAKNILVGNGLEELRAEVFSGHMQGYLEVKYFANDLSILIGLNLMDYIMSRPKGGTAYDIYAELARKVGIDRTLEISLALPDIYHRTQSGQLDRAVHAYLQGYDGILKRIYNDKMSTREAGRIERRLASVAQNIRRGGEQNAQAFFAKRRMKHNIFMTDLLEEKYLHPLGA